MKTYYLDLDSKETFSMSMSDSVNSTRMLTTNVYTICSIGRTYPSELSVDTCFLGFDAREKYPDSPLKDVPYALPFSTTGKHEGEMIKTFWATYEQAKLGHKVRVSFYEDPISDEYFGLHRELAEMLSGAGIGNIASLTLRSSDIFPKPKFQPITLPVSGYRDDIERFIQL